ncbi:MAG: hypothetical protein ABEJ82_05560 [Haloplanus sp.]
MSTDGWRSATAAVRAWWTGLDSDWQSVVVGAVIVACTVAFGVRIPW